MEEMNMTMSDGITTVEETPAEIQETEVIEPEVVDPKGNNLVRNGLIGAATVAGIGLAIKLYEKCKNKKAAANGQPQKKFKLQLPWAWEDVPQQPVAPAPGSNGQVTPPTPETK